ncbi:D-3-phosphoglycerate dehydrogenase [Sphaerotilus hippei]|uniref:D-3-phosphoglycerate dehydrogenase n=1 Tax=Sphaerotilus hippei TaxID=744406 RepID=A0A318GY09_9BURK|nr:NAD(P)-dependent oxidoreductase [Sphaerotilus hippei]PXW94549.1 D-3-phosphoglycerate dehydrogenase [Sphaerotilus hippei]
MDLLIAEPLEADVLQWLDSRHALHYAPRLADEPALLEEALSQARAAMLPARTRVDARTLAQAVMLRAIGRIVGGPENIDHAACKRAGIEVVRCMDATVPAEAEFMLGAVLSLLRPAPEDLGRLAGRELGQSTIGLVGMTAATRRLAQLVRPFGCTVIGYDPTVHASDRRWDEWEVQPIALRELFETADVVCVGLAYFSRYRGVLGERNLAACKPGQVLVCTASSALFDHATLARVLGSGRMTSAWLDQAELDLQAPGQVLHRVRGLMTTPRLASYTRESRLRSAWGVARRLDEILRCTPAVARSGTRRASHATDEPMKPVAAPPAGPTASGLIRPPGAPAAGAAWPASR